MRTLAPFSAERRAASRRGEERRERRSYVAIPGENEGVSARTVTALAGRRGEDYRRLSSQPAYLQQPASYRQPCISCSNENQQPGANFG
jgi:hypothetical protein